ncbi:hypothetical protein D3C81_689440 [compost metagenome]
MRRRFDLVDVEGMLVQARYRRAGQLAAAGQHQTVVAQLASAAGFVAVADLAGLLVDALGGAPDEAHAHGLEQLGQRSEHAMHIGFVEARADAQFGLRRQQGDFHIVAAVHVQQAGGAQCAPQSTEARANNQKLLFHHVLLTRMDEFP